MQKALHELRNSLISSKLLRHPADQLKRLVTLAFNDMVFVNHRILRTE